MGRPGAECGDARGKTLDHLWRQFRQNQLDKLRPRLFFGEKPGQRHHENQKREQTENTEESKIPRVLNSVMLNCIDSRSVK
jgi:hypothetical protein